MPGAAYADRTLLTSTAHMPWLWLAFFILQQSVPLLDICLAKPTLMVQSGAAYADRLMPCDTTNTPWLCLAW